MTTHSIGEAVRKQDPHTLMTGIWQFLTKQQTYLPFDRSIKLPDTVRWMVCSRWLQQYPQSHMFSLQEARASALTLFLLRGRVYSLPWNLGGPVTKVEVMLSDFRLGQWKVLTASTCFSWKAAVGTQTLCCEETQATQGGKVQKPAHSPSEVPAHNHHQPPDR